MAYDEFRFIEQFRIDDSPHTTPQIAAEVEAARTYDLSQRRFRSCGAHILRYARQADYQPTPEELRQADFIAGITLSRLHRANRGIGIYTYPDDLSQKSDELIGLITAMSEVENRQGCLLSPHDFLKGTLLIQTDEDEFQSVGKQNGFAFLERTDRVDLLLQAMAGTRSSESFDEQFTFIVPLDIPTDIREMIDYNSALSHSTSAQAVKQKPHEWPIEVSQQIRGQSNTDEPDFARFADIPERKLEMLVEDLIADSDSYEEMVAELRQAGTPESAIRGISYTYFRKVLAFLNGAAGMPAGYFVTIVTPQTVAMTLEQEGRGWSHALVHNTRGSLGFYERALTLGSDDELEANYSIPFRERLFREWESDPLTDSHDAALIWAMLQSR